MTMRAIMILIHVNAWLALILIALDIAISGRRVDKHGEPFL